MKQFTQLFQSYILDGFQGKSKNDSVHAHLQLLIEARGHVVAVTQNKTLGQNSWTWIWLGVDNIASYILRELRTVFPPSIYTQ